MVVGPQIHFFYDINSGLNSEYSIIRDAVLEADRVGTYQHFSYNVQEMLVHHII